MKTSTELLVERLERIARENDDHFTYEIGISPQRKGEFYYAFICRSESLGMTFTCRGGMTQSDAALEAENSIETACGYHKYKNAE